MTLTVVVIGQRRLGRYTSPWTRGWLHPRSKTLRLKKHDPLKRAGETFGGGWVECWRELHDKLDREDWLEMMRKDLVMQECLFSVDVPVPRDRILVMVRALALNKMLEIVTTTKPPAHNFSACDWPRRCKFHDCCWQFCNPTEPDGFVQISALLVPS